MIREYSNSPGFASRPDPPSIAELDNFFRQAGVDLAAQACRKALKEWRGDLADITHTVAVTCTSQGNPGYDLFVARKLGLPDTTERVLLHGVGCAGGLAILRVAAQIACGAAARRRPARILAFACELCTLNARHELAEAEACGDPDELSSAAVLFADGAGAFVLCNEYGLLEEREDSDSKRGVYQLHEWGNATIPGTAQHVGFYTDPTGYRMVQTRSVAGFIKNAIGPLFERLLPLFRDKTGQDTADVADFDWALHPSSDAVITGAENVLGLASEQLRATRQIYKTRGNTSSAAVLTVLDLLRKMGPGKDCVVATSFGPGIVIEMALFTRCRN